MYTIQHYKTKRKESKNKPTNPLEEKYYNIKSITIDLDDIKHIIEDKRLKHLLGLYIRVRRKNLDDSIKSIIILNNNIVNLLFIDEIINCDWMINKDAELKELDVLKMVRKFYTLQDQYEKETSNKTKNEIKNKLDLIKYYIDTILNKDTINKDNNNSIKLGNQFIKKK